MKKIIALHDYKGQYASKYYGKIYRSGMDRNLLGQQFEKHGIQVEFLTFCDPQLFVKIKDYPVIYTSQEDSDYKYKDFIEDIVLDLESNGAMTLPKYLYLRANNNKVFMEMLRRRILPEKYQLQTHWYGTLEEASYMIPISVLLNIPLINNQITSASKPHNVFVKMLNKINYYFSDFILSNSYAGIKSSNPPKHKSGVIHNGFDNNRFIGKESHVRQELNISQDAIIIVMISRFSPGKDYKTLINAANILLFKKTHVYFFLVGDGPDKERMERLITGEHSDNIIFLGQRKDVEEILLGSDIGVLLNDTDISKEGLSNSIMEYMAAGLPVVATDAGGNPELIIDNESGFLIENKDKEQLIDRLGQLISSNELRKKMGDKAQERIKNKFSLSNFVEKHEEIIKRFIK